MHTQARAGRCQPPETTLLFLMLLSTAICFTRFLLIQTLLILSPAPKEPNKMTTSRVLIMQSTSGTFSGQSSCAESFCRAWLQLRFPGLDVCLNPPPTTPPQRHSLKMASPGILRTLIMLCTRPPPLTTYTALGKEGVKRLRGVRRKRWRRLEKRQGTKRKTAVVPAKGWVSGGGGLMNPDNTPVRTHTFRSLITCLICRNDGTCRRSPGTGLGCANNLVNRYLMLIGTNNATDLASC